MKLLPSHTLPGSMTGLATGKFGDGKDVAPIEPNTFVSHVKSFSREIAPDHKQRGQIDATKDLVARVTFRVCVDSKGRIDDVVVDAVSPEFPGYDERVTNAVRAWQLKPFEARGKALRGCTRLTVGYPSQRIGFPLDIEVPRPPPPPPPPQSVGSADPRAKNLAPVILEARRKTGDKNIVPDPGTIAQMRQDGTASIESSFKVCVSTAGSVAHVEMVKSTGYYRYDTRIRLEIVEWTYKPYELNGKVVPVCSAVTVTYPPQ